MPTRIARVLITALLLTVGTASCSLFHRVNTNADGNADIRLYVDNQHFNDATIYALFDGGIPIRLGQVVGLTKEVFTFPYRPGEFRLQIRLLAGGTHTTEPMQIYRGDELDLVIPSDIDWR